MFYFEEIVLFPGDRQAQRETLWAKIDLLNSLEKKVNLKYKIKIYGRVPTCDFEANLKV